MSALFRKVHKDKVSNKLGDVRSTRKLYIVKRIENETRWFGRDWVQQECVRSYCSTGPEGPSYACNKWRDKHWASSYSSMDVPWMVYVAAVFWCGLLIGVAL